MQTFRPEKSQSSVDFLAFSVARMEMENHHVSASSVANVMPPEMANTFFKRLQFYRLQVRDHPEMMLADHHNEESVTE